MLQLVSLASTVTGRTAAIEESTLRVLIDLLVAFGDQPSINFAGVVIGCFRLGEFRL